MAKLAGKRALISGGGTGIGRGIAQSFLDEGAKVVICGRRHGPLKETVDELGKLGAIQFIECDISDPADVKSLVEETVKLLGGLDILVNNAGVYEGGNLETVPLKEWDRTLSINLRGVFLLTKECMPHLRKAGRGANVLNISSTMAQHLERETLPYAVSKSALETFTRCCAVDFGETGLRFNAIVAGVVDTPMQDFGKGELGFQEWRSAMANIHPLKVVGKPRDIAAAALFLCGPEAEWITGTIMSVDGGITAA